MAIATSSWIGEPQVKGSSQSMRLFLLTFSLIGLQFCWGSTFPRLSIGAHANISYKAPSKRTRAHSC